MTHKDKIKIVEKLVIPSKEKGFWGREIKHVNDLIRKGFSDLEFWEKFEPGEKVPSLAWYKSAHGGKNLQGFYNSYLLKRAEKMREVGV